MTARGAMRHRPGAHAAAAACRRAFLAGAVAVLPLAAGAAAESERRCTIGASFTGRGARDVTLIGSSLASTRRAGAGDVRFDLRSGEDRRVAGRAVRGRLVAVEALDRRTRAMLPRGVARVLLVPWGYDTTCRRTAGGDNVSRWARPGTRGLFRGELRPRAHWAGGVPTIDVFAPYDLPYTGRPRFSVDTAAWLTPAELLGLYDAVRAAADAAGARTATRAWARAHPVLARRAPATGVLFAMRDPGQAPRFENVESPIVGTWRLEGSLDGGAARAGWLRTWHRTSRIDVEQPAPAAVAADPLAPPRVTAYYVVAAGGAALAALPVAAPPHRVPRSGYLRVAVSDERAPLDAGPWRGGVDLDVLAPAFAHDTALAAFMRDALAESGGRHRPGWVTEHPATFARDADGTLRVEQRTTLADGRTLLVRGERVSPVAIRERGRAP